MAIDYKQCENELSDIYGQIKESETSRDYSERAGGDCFIATAAYGTPMTYEIYILRKWRDESLLNNEIGKKLVKLYYKLSPSIAKNIQRSETKKLFVRAILKPIIKLLSYKYER